MYCTGRDFNGDTPVVVGLKNYIVVHVTVSAIHPTDNLISKFVDSLLQMTFETWRVRNILKQFKYSKRKRRSHHSSSQMRLNKMKFLRIIVWGI